MVTWREVHTAEIWPKFSNGQAEYHGPAGPAGLGQYDTEASGFLLHCSGRTVLAPQCCSISLGMLVPCIHVAVR